MTMAFFPATIGAQPCFGWKGPRIGAAGAPARNRTDGGNGIYHIGAIWLAL